jgi:hypothetical protein
LRTNWCQQHDQSRLEVHDCHAREDHERDDRGEHDLGQVAREVSLQRLDPLDGDGGDLRHIYGLLQTRPHGSQSDSQDGDMRKRWTAAGMLVAEQQFRRIIGYRDLAKLVIAIERHADRVKHTTLLPPMRAWSCHRTWRRRAS